MLFLLYHIKVLGLQKEEPTNWKQEMEICEEKEVQFLAFSLSKTNIALIGNTIKWRPKRTVRALG